MYIRNSKFRASEQLYEGKYKMVNKSIYREKKLLDLISLNVESAELAFSN